MSFNLEHLKMIEDVINRLAGNSFALKGWSLTITTALLAFAGVKENAVFLCIGMIPIVFFWMLDSYYLWMEKRYRDLYDKVRKADSTDFSMSVRGIKIRFPVFSVTESAYYLPQLALLVLIIFISKGYK